MKPPVGMALRKPQPGFADILRIGLSCFGALAAMVTSIQAAPVVNPATGHSYELIKEEKTWVDARTAASSMSTKQQLCYLATVTSAAENDFVVALLPKEGPDPGDTEIEAWIGGQRKVACTGDDDASNWGKWVTGEPWSYTNWLTDESEPDACDESCLSYEGDPPRWSNAFCDDETEDSLWYLVECQPLAGAPALSEPGMIILGVILAVWGGWVLKRRSTRTT